MYKNTLGVQGRGVSNSIASPGVSMLFGAMPSFPTTNSTYGSKPNRSSVTNRQIDRPSTAPVEPKQAQALRSERTYQQPEVIDIAPTQAASNTESQAHREPVQRKEWIIPEPKPTQETVPESALHASEHSNGDSAHHEPLTLAKLQKAYQLLNFRAKEVNNRSLPPTELQARLVYRNQRGDIPTAAEIADALHSDFKASKDELAHAHRDQQEELSHELTTQLKNEHKRKVEEKQAIREAHHASPGFNFEFYSRHPRMLEETKKTGQFVRSQKAEDEAKRRNDIYESRQLPSKVKHFLINHFRTT